MRRSLPVAALIAFAVTLSASTPSVVAVRDTTAAPNAMLTDVRWATDSSVFVCDLNEGVFEMPLAKTRESKSMLKGGSFRKPGSGATTSLFLPAYIGVSKDYVVAGALLRQVAWKARNGETFIQAPFANALDVDVWNDRAIVLGVRGDDGMHWGSVGATLWLVSLSHDRADFKGITASAPDAMRKCGFEGIGAVRFYPDGRFVHIPGVTPGMELYDRSGKLIRRWNTDILSVDDHCNVTAAQADAFAEATVRADWMNRRQIVDEVLPLAEGPLVIVRRAVPGGVVWRGVLVPFDGDPVAVSIPVTSTSRLAHLHADLKGDRVIFLVADFPLRNGVDTPARLVTARIVR
jgi:hypothetical protein